MTTHCTPQEGTLLGFSVAESDPYSLRLRGTGVFPGQVCEGWKSAELALGQRVGLPRAPHLSTLKVGVQDERRQRGGSQVSERSVLGLSSVL